MNSSNIQFLSVSDAQKTTGKSQSTINRIVNKYKGSKYVKKDGKKYLVSSEIITELFTKNSDTIQMNSHLDSNMNSLLYAKNETIEILRNELGKKDQVINNQAGQISELIQRNRESNIIIKSLQEQIKLPELAQIIEQPISTVHVNTERHTNTPLIMELHAKGLKYREIAEQLNRKGLRNQFGKKYNKEAIKTTVNRNK